MPGFTCQDASVISYTKRQFFLDFDSQCFCHSSFCHNPSPLFFFYFARKVAWERSFASKRFFDVPHKSRRSALQGSAPSADDNFFCNKLISLSNAWKERGKGGKFRSAISLQILDKRPECVRWRNFLRFSS